RNDAGVQAGDHLGADRQLGGAEAQRFTSHVVRHAVDFEHDAARGHASGPMVHRALALTHPHFGRLAGDRHVGEDTDPDAALTLHLTGDRAASRFDLTRRDALRLDGLQTVGAEVQRETTLGRAVDAAFEGLAVLGLFRLQHGLSALTTTARTAITAGAATAFVGRRTRGFLGPALVLSHRVVLEHFTLKHPDLHANDAVGRLGFIEAIVDVGAQGVQRHATFAVPLHPSDFGAAQTARDVDADALGAQAHGRLHRTLHGAAERDTALQLLSDVLGDQLSVGFRLADLDDVQVNFAFGASGDVLAQLLDVSALLADHDTRTGGVDRHAALLVRTLDDDARHAGGRQAFLQPRAQLQVLVEQFGVVGAAGEPAAVPRAVHAEAQTDRIDFLTHQAASPASRTTMVISLNGFRMRDERPRARLAKRFITRFLPTKASATTRLSM